MVQKLKCVFSVVMVSVSFTACLDTQLPPSPGPGSITGRVLVASPGEPLGVPAAGASVSLVEAGLVVSTSADGRFTLSPVNQSMGTVEIAAGPLRRVLSLESLGAGFGRAVALGDVALSRNASVQGEVLLADGAAPAGTLVFLEGQPSSAYTNQAGQFLLRELPVGAVTLSVYRPGYEPQRVPLELRSGERTTLDALTLRAQVVMTTRVRGRALLAGRDDASGITVSMGTQQASVAPDGSWRLDAVPAGIHTFTFRAEGHRTITLVNRLIAAAEVELPQVTLTAGEAGTEPFIEPFPAFDAGTGGGGGSADDGGSTGGGGGSTGGGGGSTGGGGGSTGGGGGSTGGGGGSTGGGGGTVVDAGEPLPVIQVSAGVSHTCAVLSDRTLFCWGRDTFGQVSGPGGADAVKPMLVARDVSEVAAGGTHTCALHTDAGVECWGANADYQLGVVNADGGRAALPIAARALAAGARSTCVVSGAQIRCWGANTDYQLGNGTVSSRSLPDLMNNITIAEAVAPGDAHTCAIMTVNGAPNVVCTGRLFANATQPGGPIISDVLELTSGGQHSCARRTDGVWCWGLNGAGQLGYAGAQQLSPTLVPGTTTAQAVEAGGQHTCALVTNGAVECWGSNSSGQLGVGSTDGGIARVTAAITTVTAVSAGGLHTCAIKFDGSLWCWGNNGYGQLGVDAGPASSVPVRVVIE
jgi:alpha-tubulin suppressor-like RCC1 family protein